MANVYPAPEAIAKFWDAAVPFTSGQVKTAISESPLKHLQLLMIDRMYYCLPDNLCVEMLHEIGTNRIKYIAERFDCDNFSSYFKAVAALNFGTNSVGMILDISGQHSYNCVLTCIDSSSPVEVKEVEPQSDTFITKYPDAKRHYAGTSGIILL